MTTPTYCTVGTETIEGDWTPAFPTIFDNVPPMPAPTPANFQQTHMSRATQTAPGIFIPKIVVPRATVLLSSHQPQNFAVNPAAAGQWSPAQVMNLAAFIAATATIFHLGQTSPTALSQAYTYWLSQFNFQPGQFSAPSQLPNPLMFHFGTHLNASNPSAAHFVANHNLLPEDLPPRRIRLSSSHDFSEAPSRPTLQQHRPQPQPQPEPPKPILERIWAWFTSPDPTPITQRKRKREEEDNGAESNERPVRRMRRRLPKRSRVWLGTKYNRGSVMDVDSDDEQLAQVVQNPPLLSHLWFIV